jgi:hypothetical protein
MGKSGAFNGTYRSGSNTIKMNLPVIYFEEDNCQIMYCPALDISGYGKTENEAKESFNIALGEFFTYTLHKKTFRSVLADMGWILKKSKHKPMHPPEMDELLRTNDNFSRIFNTFDFRKSSQTFNIPACA